MFQKLLFFLLLVGITKITVAQNRQISGYVYDRQSTEALAYCSIIIQGTTIGTSSDVNGFFKLDLPKENENGILISSLIGYLQSSINLLPNKSFYRFNLNPSSGNIKEVVVSGTMKEMSKLDSPIPVEVYNPSFFKKNPTPSIFESLNMVNGVMPQLNCNVCNTGDIHINGMEGPYTMILIDGMPIVSSLSSVYGLSGIPNSLVQRIEIVKGPASTLYGSEAVGGLINIITKNPVSAPLLNIDLSTTTWNEINADVTAKFKLKKATSLIGINSFYYNDIKDKNNDGFTDITLQKRISIFNKWNFIKKNNQISTIALRYIYEDRWGGQTNYLPKFRGTDSIYAETIFTNRFELIGNYGFLIKKEKVRFQYSYNYHLQDSYYGTTKYFANQHTAFAQLLYDKKIANHDLLFGIPFRFNYYDDNSPATASSDSINPLNSPQNIYLPGFFIQDEWKWTEKMTSLVGIRYDHNNIHGSIFTPRISFKFKDKKQNILRLSAGNGYRVVNLFTEDHAALTGAREVIIREELKPEQTWNVNLNYVKQINHKIGFVGLDASIFYTYFSNKIIGDYNIDPNKIIYDNLNGYAISKGITLNTDFAFNNGLKIIAGTTIMEVYQIEKDSNNKNIRIEQQFAPKVSANYAISYTISKIGLAIDFTGRVNGPMYLPVLPNDFRPEKSPIYNIMNIQFTKKIKQNLELYSGIKNILNFTPSNPILRPFDPFDKNVNDPINNPNGYTFDPNYNYAPLQGIRGFFGVRWTL